MLPNEQLSLRNKNWRKNLEKFMKEIIKKYGQVTIILFGSRARGDYSALSDTDILIIMNKTSIRILEDVISIAYKSDLVSPEIHLFEKKWVLENFEKNTIILDAIYEGKILIDDLGITEQLKKRLENMLKEGWIKNKNGWFRKNF